VCSYYPPWKYEKGALLERGGITCLADNRMPDRGQVTCSIKQRPWRTIHPIL
jgi:hypothetical protein